MKSKTVSLLFFFCLLLLSNCGNKKEKSPQQIQLYLGDQYKQGVLYVEACYSDDLDPSEFPNKPYIKVEVSPNSKWEKEALNTESKTVNYRSYVNYYDDMFVGRIDGEVEGTSGSGNWDNLRGELKESPSKPRCWYLEINKVFNDLETWANAEMCPFDKIRVLADADRGRQQGQVTGRIVETCVPPEKEEPVVQGAPPPLEKTSTVEAKMKTPTSQESSTPEIVYIVPAYTEAIYERHHSWGTDDQFEADFTCTVTYTWSANKNDRVLNGVVKTVCPAGHADEETEWTYQIDRLTGKSISSTCAACFYNHEPNPGYIGPTQIYAGFTIPIITETVDIVKEEKPYQDEHTNGFWQWVGTETRTFDGITGRFVKLTWDHRNLFTGTYDAVQYTAEYFGNWDKGEMILISTNYPLGVVP